MDAPPQTPKYDFYQSDTHVTVSLQIRNPDPSAIVKTLEPRLCALQVGTMDGKRYALTLHLLGGIVPEKCELVHNAYKVELKLSKETLGQWASLEQAAVPAAPGASSPALSPPPSQPPHPQQPVKTPYASKKDWNALEREVLQDAEKPSGDQAMNALFQQIYRDADEDTRRAMIKSYQTSGGTVLTTNWKDAGQTDYEKKRKAPKGSEWKSWEGQVLAGDEDSDGDEGQTALKATKPS